MKRILLLIVLIVLVNHTTWSQISSEVSYRDTVYARVSDSYFSFKKTVFEDIQNEAQRRRFTIDQNGLIWFKRIINSFADAHRESLNNPGSFNAVSVHAFIVLEIDLMNEAIFYENYHSLIGNDFDNYLSGINCFYPLCNKTTGKWFWKR